MKAIYTQILLGLLVLTTTCFSGCKKGDDEIDSSFIETKLITGTSEQWSTSIILEKDISAGTTSTIRLNADHTFNYTGGTSFTGSWNADYTANRSGQILKLNFTYLYNFSNYQETHVLKYSSENDIFYVLDQSDVSLVPFKKIVYNP